MPITNALKPRLRVRLFMLIAPVMILLFPMGGFYLSRLYENELFRQAETELIVQGAHVAALYRELYVVFTPEASAEGRGTQPRFLPMLDLNSALLQPRRPEAMNVTQGPDAVALQAAKYLQPVLKEVIGSTGTNIIMTDASGIIIAGGDEPGMSLVQTKEVASALEGNYMAQWRQADSTEPSFALKFLTRLYHTRIHAAIPVMVNNHVAGVVLLSQSPRNWLEIIQAMPSVWWGVCAIAIVMAVLIWSIHYYGIQRPVAELLVQVRRIRLGEANVAPLMRPVTQEIAELSDGISGMGYVISRRADYIGRFAMRLSQEFKTPLTTILCAVELIQEHGKSMPPEQFRKFIANIAKDTERLKALVANMQDLAQSETQRPEPGNCDFAGLVKDLQAAYHYKGIAVIPRHTVGVSLPMAEDLVRKIFIHLIENSRQHGATQFEIGVSFGEELQITVKDNGRGISPAIAEKLFTPFFSTRHDQGGTGLGLVNVRSQLKAYGCNIEYKPVAQGAAFIIKVPIHARTDTPLF